MDVFTIAVITVVAAAAAFIFYKVQYTKKNGIEADAVVSRIEEENHVDSDGSSTSYNYFVKYTDTEGKRQEAKLSNSGFRGFSVGQRIRIKYLPEKPKVAVWIKK